MIQQLPQLLKQHLSLNASGQKHHHRTETSSSLCPSVFACMRACAVCVCVCVCVREHVRERERERERERVRVR